MPLQHIRVCDRCEVVRCAPCFIGCRIESQPWEDNIQDGAGTFEAEL